MSVSFSLFPSPRGVELHKLANASSYGTLSNAFLFPSPRGVELHKLSIAWFLVTGR